MFVDNNLNYGNNMQIINKETAKENKILFISVILMTAVPALLSVLVVYNPIANFFGWEMMPSANGFEIIIYPVVIIVTTMFAVFYWLYYINRFKETSKVFFIISMVFSCVLILIIFTAIIPILFYIGHSIQTKINTSVDTDKTKKPNTLLYSIILTILSIFVSLPSLIMLPIFFENLSALSDFFSFIVLCILLLTPSVTSVIFCINFWKKYFNRNNTADKQKKLYENSNHASSSNVNANIVVENSINKKNVPKSKMLLLLSIIMLLVSLIPATGTIQSFYVDDGDSVTRVIMMLSTLYMLILTVATFISYKTSNYIMAFRTFILSLLLFFTIVIPILFFVGYYNQKKLYNDAPSN